MLIMETGNKTICMDLGLIFLKTEIPTMDNSKGDSNKDMVKMNMHPGMFTKEAGFVIKRKDWVYCAIKMGVCLLDSFLAIKKLQKGFILGKMGTY